VLKSRARGADSKRGGETHDVSIVCATGGVEQPRKEVEDFYDAKPLISLNFCFCFRDRKYVIEIKKRKGKG